MPRSRRSLGQVPEEMRVESDAFALKRAAEILKSKSRLQKARKYLAGEVKEATEVLKNVDGLRK